MVYKRPLPLKAAKWLNKLGQHNLRKNVIKSLLAILQ